MGAETNPAEVVAVVVFSAAVIVGSMFAVGWWALATFGYEHGLLLLAMMAVLLVYVILASGAAEDEP